MQLLYSWPWTGISLFEQGELKPAKANDQLNISSIWLLNKEFSKTNVKDNISENNINLVNENLIENTCLYKRSYNKLCNFSRFEENKTKRHDT